MFQIVFSTWSKLSIFLFTSPFPIVYFLKSLTSLWKCYIKKHYILQKNQARTSKLWPQRGNVQMANADESCKWDQASVTGVPPTLSHFEPCLVTITVASRHSDPSASVRPNCKNSILTDALIKPKRIRWILQRTKETKVWKWKKHEQCNEPISAFLAWRLYLDPQLWLLYPNSKESHLHQGNNM